MPSGTRFPDEDGAKRLTKGFQNRDEQMISRQAALDLAQQAFLFLADDPETLAGFLGASGLDAGQLRDQIGRAEFGESVLDFLLQSDQQVLAFAQVCGVPAQQVLQAQAVLSQRVGSDF